MQSLYAAKLAARLRKPEHPDMHEVSKATRLKSPATVIRLRYELGNLGPRDSMIGTLVWVTEGRDAGFNCD
jgi:hypothetical protein